MDLEQDDDSVDKKYPVMGAEQADGNIEYKLKLVNKTPHRLEGIISQMRFRCEEGGSECIYNLGVCDDGTMVGITVQEYEQTLQTLTSAATRNNYVVTLLSRTMVEEDRSVYEVLIREHNDDKYIDVKVAVAGNVDSGKSSLMGVLTNNKLDNGRGSARLSIFNYPHEIRTGRTSSIGHHIIGFDAKGDIINYQGIGDKMSWPDIVRRSCKIISLYDLAGHEKYLKTTILGLACAEPDLCLIIVAANKGIRNERTKTSGRCSKRQYDNMTKEHIFLCITLGIPFAIVITKVDMIKGQGIQNIYQETVRDIQKIVKSPGIRRQPIRIQNDEDVLICAKQVHTESIVPIFSISNVTGQGVNQLRTFLNLLGKTNRNCATDDVELRIDSAWSVTGVGTVIGGHLVSGTINVNDKLYIGPNHGKYEQVSIRSIHCKRVPLQSVSHGSYVCLALKKFERSNIRRGNVIVSHTKQHVLTKEFIADIKVMRSHSTTIRVGYQPVINVAAIRQTASLLSIKNKVNARNPEQTINDDILRTGDMATVKFRFYYQPEFLNPGMRILCSEGRTKVVGIVREVLE